MIQDTSVITYKSKIDPSYTVFIVYKEYEHYNVVKEMLTRSQDSIAVLQIGTKNIYVDGEIISEDMYTEDHLLAIEAHEIAHSILGHVTGVNVSSEKEADLFATLMLRNRNMTEAADLLIDRLRSLYGIDYYTFDSAWRK